MLTHSMVHCRVLVPSMMTQEEQVWRMMGEMMKDVKVIKSMIKWMSGIFNIQFFYVQVIPAFLEIFRSKPADKKIIKQMGCIGGGNI